MATERKLIVEVVNARNLLPKDGNGSSSPYVVVDYYGQRKRTQTAIRDLNPTWNQLLEFNVGKPSHVFEDVLELDIYHDTSHGPTRRNNFLGRIRLSSSHFVKKGEDALIYFPLEKKNFFSWIQGDIGLKIFYVDEVLPPPPPAVPEQPKSESTPPPPEAQPASDDQQATTNVEYETPLADQPQPPTENIPQLEKIQEKSASTEIDEDAPEQPQIETKPSLPPQPPESLQSEPNIEMVTATVPKSVPEIKFAGPHPVKNPTRSNSAMSFVSSFDISEIMSFERSTFDMVEKMHYLFVRVVKARGLPTNGCPVAKISVSNYHIRSKPARKAGFFNWDQTFAFARDSPDSSSILEVSVWDPPIGADPSSDGHDLLGGICFDVTEIPMRDPPDSPLAPQWYRLEGGGAHCSDLMLATWLGTQADEAFPDAWKTDTAGNPNSRAKVYQSPKMWYLRATVLEAQDVLPTTMSSKEPAFQIKAQLGFQTLKTKPSVSRTGTPTWNEDLMFVAAEPFSDRDYLTFNLEYRQPKGSVCLGLARVALGSIERRVDDRKVASKWFGMEEDSIYNEKNKKKLYRGRLHLQLCFDGGYHVMDEVAHLCSDYRPTARQLWKPPIGTIELGIIGCKNLVPVKMVNDKGRTDAYCVAKYGPKWVRTRTVSDSLVPKWNEQYTFKVFDPCTVLTIGVFDSWEGSISEIEGESPLKNELIGTTTTNTPRNIDFRIGKVRIRVSTLTTGRVYRNIYPLLVLTHAGTKKMGEVEIAIRFVRMSPTLDFIHVYSQPLLPLMHHIKPLGVVQQDVLRSTAIKILSAHLSRSEPPLRSEIVLYMLDADSHSFSMRKVRVNWFRIINVITGLIDIARWVEDTRSWKNPTATLLVHALLVLLVWFPDLIVPTLAFYMFVIGAWNYRFRARDPLPHFDPKLSLTDSVDRDELDEEFDTIPSSTRPLEAVKVRYDKLRALGTRVQTVLGDVAAQGERLQALVTWCDPRATGIFIGLCFVVAMMLYLVPSKMVAMAFGFYYMRHPIFRDRMPSPALNFFRRLPSLVDRIM